METYRYSIDDLYKEWQGDEANMLQRETKGKRVWVCDGMRKESKNHKRTSSLQGLEKIKNTKAEHRKEHQAMHLRHHSVRSDQYTHALPCPAPLPLLISVDNHLHQRQMARTAYSTLLH